LTLLAKIWRYKNLIRLVTISNLEGYYYKPRMDKEILRKYLKASFAFPVAWAENFPARSPVKMKRKLKK